MFDLRPAARSAVLCLGLSACVLSADPASLAGVSGEMLSVRTAAGVEALGWIQEWGEPARSWIRREGRPDYVLIESQRAFSVFYIDRDQLVRFRRGLFSRAVEAVVSRPIRSDHHVRFRDRDRQRLARARMDPPRSDAGRPARDRVLRRRVGSDPAARSSRGRP